MFTSKIASIIAITGLMYMPVANAHNTTVAIIDSGTDMQHKDIAPKAWINPVDIPNNQRDEDGNGYQDDEYGWNFAEGNNQVIDYSYLGTLTDDIRRFFKVQADAMLGRVSQEDLNWARAQIKDQAFIKRISIYGNFMHGTHVAGISARDNDEAKVLAVKLIPTEVKVPGQHKSNDPAAPQQGTKGFKMYLLKKALGALAKQQMTQMEEIAAYVSNEGAKVANGSFGTGWPQATTLVKTLASKVWKNITKAEVEEATRYFFSELIKDGKMMTDAAPNTLFVFAAGNDGLNNDKYPTSPTNLQAPNVISVAATLQNVRLASFSNYGATMVDVAAPGVNIRSSVPGNNYLRVSGTSQAAPYVTQVAVAMKTVNENITPGDMRKVLMETVDKRAWLDGKVVSGGTVNRQRAVRAAELANTMNLTDAIAQAKSEIKMVEVNQKSLSLGNLVPEANELVLPLQSSIIIKE